VGGSLPNPSYSGGRDQEAHRRVAEGSWSEASPDKEFMRPYLKNTQCKRAGRVAQVVEHMPRTSPEFKFQYCKIGKKYGVLVFPVFDLMSMYSFAPITSLY
jgi:hypothetical protein